MLFPYGLSGPISLLLFFFGSSMVEYQTDNQVSMMESVIVYESNKLPNVKKAV
jgi:hypothetical protein